MVTLQVGDESLRSWTYILRKLQSGRQPFMLRGRHVHPVDISLGTPLPCVLGSLARWDDLVANSPKKHVYDRVPPRTLRGKRGLASGLGLGAGYERVLKRPQMMFDSRKSPACGLMHHPADTLQQRLVTTNRHGASRIQASGAKNQYLIGLQDEN